MVTVSFLFFFDLASMKEERDDVLRFLNSSKEISFLALLVAFILVFVHVDRLAAKSLFFGKAESVMLVGSVGCSFPQLQQNHAQSGFFLHHTKQYISRSHTYSECMKLINT